MGYFTSGFVFTSEPRFAEIAATFPALVVRGYQRGVEPIWLLDLFEKPWRKNVTHSPFTARTGEMEVSPPTPAPGTARFIGELETLLAVLPQAGIRSRGA